MMKRREFISLLSGAAVAWPLTARAQQPERVRRVGALMTFTADDPEGQARMLAFAQELHHLGWIVGRNLRIDIRWGEGDADRNQRYAAELVSLGPDALLANGSLELRPLQQATSSVPIVFANAADRVGQGFVASLARPGGNVTGFASAEFGQSGKWLELLKEIAPRVTRAAVLRDPGVTAGIGQFAVIQSVARSVGVEVSPINVRDISGVESAVADFAHSPNGGLVVTASATAAAHRKLII